jgi:hypothetical protein
MILFTLFELSIIICFFKHIYENIVYFLFEYIFIYGAPSCVGVRVSVLTVCILCVLQLVSVVPYAGVVTVLAFLFIPHHICVSRRL